MIRWCTVEQGAGPELSLAVRSAAWDSSTGEVFFHVDAMGPGGIAAAVLDDVPVLFGRAGRQVWAPVSWMVARATEAGDLSGAAKLGLAADCVRNHLGEKHGAGVAP